MRVDWCVSSWFRIKNTHSLTTHSREETLFTALFFRRKYLLWRCALVCERLRASPGGPGDSQHGGFSMCSEKQACGKRSSPPARVRERPDSVCQVALETRSEGDSLPQTAGLRLGPEDARRLLLKQAAT